MENGKVKYCQLKYKFIVFSNKNDSSQSIHKHQASLSFQHSRNHSEFKICAKPIVTNRVRKHTNVHSYFNTFLSPSPDISHVLQEVPQIERKYFSDGHSNKQQYKSSFLTKIRTKCALNNRYKIEVSFNSKKKLLFPKLNKIRSVIHKNREGLKIIRNLYWDHGYNQQLPNGVIVQSFC